MENKKRAHVVAAAASRRPPEFAEPDRSDTLAKHGSHTGSGLELVREDGKAS